MNANDIELCRVYGQISREYLGDVSWEQSEPRLREGWNRLRRDPAVDWDRAEPLVRTFWNLAPRVE